MQHLLTVKNVKCGGCAAIIENTLGKIDGVEKVAVDIASGQVTVDSSDSVSKESLSAALAALGYPEQG